MAIHSSRVATLAGFVERLKELKISRAAEGLSPKSEQRNEFGYGFACGIQAGLDMASEALDVYLSTDSEEK